MKSLELNNTELAEETLLSYKGHKFSVVTQSGGQYGFERRVYIRVIKEDLKSFVLQNVGILRTFEDSKKDETYSKSEGCLIKGRTNYADCLEESKKFIKKYVNFIKED